MDLDRALPAAVVAATVMLPRWVPNRRGLSLTALGAARAMVSEQRTPGVHVLSVTGTPLERGAENLMNGALSGTAQGALLLGASEVARLASRRNRLVGGLALAGAYLWADRRYDQFVRSMLEKSRTMSPAVAVENLAAEAETPLHQAAATQA